MWQSPWGCLLPSWEGTTFPSGYRAGLVVFYTLRYNEADKRQNDDTKVECRVLRQLVLTIDLDEGRSTVDTSMLDVVVPIV